MLKIIKVGKHQVRVIDKNYDFITSESWLKHLDSLSAIQLQSGISHMKEVIKNTKKTIDRDLAYENYLLLTFTWKFTYKQQLSLF